MSHWEPAGPQWPHRISTPWVDRGGLWRAKPLHLATRALLLPGADGDPCAKPGLPGDPSSSPEGSVWGGAGWGGEPRGGSGGGEGDSTPFQAPTGIRPCGNLLCAVERALHRLRDRCDQDAVCPSSSHAGQPWRPQRQAARRPTYVGGRRGAEPLGRAACDCAQQGPPGRCGTGCGAAGRVVGRHCGEPARAQLRAPQVGSAWPGLGCPLSLFVPRRALRPAGKQGVCVWADLTGEEGQSLGGQSWRLG